MKKSEWDDYPNNMFYIEMTISLLELSFSEEAMVVCQDFVGLRRQSSLLIKLRQSR